MRLAVFIISIMAAPHVAGAAALYLSENPTATPDDVMQKLKSNAKNGIMLTSGGTVGKTVWVGNF